MGLFDSFISSGKRVSDPRKYAADFEVTEEKDANGRIRKTVRYTGVWTVIREDSPAVRVRLGMAAGLGALLIAALFRMLLMNHLAGSWLQVMLPLLAALFPGMYLAMGLTALPWRGKPMRRDQYMHGFIRVFRSAAAVGVCVLIGQAAALITRAVLGDWLYLTEDWRFTGYGGFILMAAIGIIAMLRSIDVTERPNGYYREKNR